MNAAEKEPTRGPATGRNALYAQSGGVTAVINATAAGLIAAARRRGDVIGGVYAAHNGILGALDEDLMDTAALGDDDIAALAHTPASAFGTCRYKMKSLEENEAEYRRLLDVFRAHDIGWFFYNGGGDSQDTTLKISQLGRAYDYPLTCIGIPKTVDNDLPLTDCCPGFGTTAKYVAVSTREAALDVASMAKTSTKIFVLEVMGRHAGWIAAAAGLARERDGDAPHLILFPEIPFDEERVVREAGRCVAEHGHCVIVVSEGVRDAGGRFLSEAGTRDAFGHAQLGGAAPRIAQLITERLGHKHHWAVADYLQRSARHIASRTDVEQARALGEAAIEMALAGQDAVMATIVRESDNPYRWRTGSAPLADVANREKKLPRDYISKDGFGITDACKTYLRPLIEGEDYPPYKNGLPCYARPAHAPVPKKLKERLNPRQQTGAPPKK